MQLYTENIGINAQLAELYGYLLLTQYYLMSLILTGKFMQHLWQAQEPPTMLPWMKYKTQSL